MYIKIFFMFAVLVLFSACGVLASSAKINENSLTSRLNNPPVDTKRYFYAIGYGQTQEDAKNDALSTISAKISVTVASSFKSSVTATRYDGNEDVLNETKNEVISKTKEIQYSDVKIKQSYNDGQKWIVLVEVDRDKTVEIYERKLKKIDEKLKIQWELYQKATFFGKLRYSVNINRYLKQTDAVFPILYALKNDYDDSAYALRYLDYTKEMKKVESAMVFKIKSDKNSKSLASLIRSELSAKNVLFSDKNYNILIDITTKAKKRKYKSANKKFANLTFALRKTTIKVIDKNKDIVSNIVYKTKAGSSKGFEDAVERTAKYEKKIKEKGIFAFISGG